MVLSSVNKMKVFQLVFSDTGRSFYSSGDKVSGSVRLEAAQLCKVSGLRVSAAGCARVEHRGGKNRRSRSQEVEYLKYEEELRLEEQLTRDSDGCFLLQPSKTYSFQFGFELPAPGRLVSSYKGKFGYVRYYARAVLDRPSQHALQCEREFEVEEPLDVNRPDLLAPAAASKQKKVTCLFIPDGQVSITAQIDRKGFCEGEDINISAKFENTCSRIVVPKAAIIAKHLYVADGHSKVLRQKLSAVRGNHIISGMCDMWQGKTIRVPKLKPSLLGCDIIKVDYALMRQVGGEKHEIRRKLFLLPPDLPAHPREREADAGAASGHRHHPVQRRRQQDEQREQPGRVPEQLVLLPLSPPQLQ
ncbi:thioredoxin-interacting protein-like isoform X3 [Toxotes jaculatrix]|uniref:thioredoxin-interacting protein-like isoform X3 n=1 Tax=Toxotes jaculatrix TaxID=941984 RepID=UPI001B3AEB52|nr:thioredoxin-interacting protein-like isoform X3 [Toxotes jaculatrix]